MTPSFFCCNPAASSTSLFRFVWCTVAGFLRDASICPLFGCHLLDSSFHKQQNGNKSEVSSAIIGVLRTRNIEN